MNDSTPPDTPGSIPAPADGKDEQRGSKKLVAGLAFGIGSAAIVAALLFASRHKKKD